MQRTLWYCLCTYQTQFGLPQITWNWAIRLTLSDWDPTTYSNQHDISTICLYPRSNNLSYSNFGPNDFVLSTLGRNHSSLPWLWIQQSGPLSSTRDPTSTLTQVTLNPAIFAFYPEQLGIQPQILPWVTLGPTGRNELAPSLAPQLPAKTHNPKSATFLKHPCIS